MNIIVVQYITQNYTYGMKTTMTKKPRRRTKHNFNDILSDTCDVCKRTGIPRTYFPTFRTLHRSYVYSLHSARFREAMCTLLHSARFTKAMCTLLHSARFTEAMCTPFNFILTLTDVNFEQLQSQDKI